MARTAITPRTLSANGGIAAPTADAVDQANGMNLAISTSSFPAAPDMENIILVVNNSAGTTKTVIVRAGNNPPAFRAGVGDLTVSIATTVTAYIGPFHSARFAQTDGSLNVDFGSGFTGTITALLVPARF